MHIHIAHHSTDLRQFKPHTSQDQGQRMEICSIFVEFL